MTTSGPTMGGSRLPAHISLTSHGNSIGSVVAPGIAASYGAENPKWVISANYRNWKSPFKWMYRQWGAPIETARACKKIFARDVKFGPSEACELGFGCTTVGHVYGNLVHVDDEPIEKVVKVRFRNDGFYDENGVKYDAADHVTLGEDRVITLRIKN